MNATTVLSAGLAAFFVALGTAKLLALPSMQARAHHAGFSVGAFRRIGALEVLGAVGLVSGSTVPHLRTLAALGLVLLLAGALVTHLRNRDGLKGAMPALVVAGLLVALLGAQVQGW